MKTSEILRGMLSWLEAAPPEDRVSLLRAHNAVVPRVAVGSDWRIGQFGAINLSFAALALARGMADALADAHDHDHALKYLKSAIELVAKAEEGWA